MVKVAGNLGNLYNTYSSLKFFGNYSNQEIDEMIPFERNIYYNLLVQHLEERAKARKEANARRK